MASRKQENLEAAAEELRAEGIDVTFGVCDVRDADAVRAVVDRVVADRGGLDIVVNNAAGNFPAPMSKISPNGFKAVVDIDLLGTYNVTRAAFDAWLRDHGGNIVNISAPFEQRGGRLPGPRGGGEVRRGLAHPDLRRRMGPVRHPGQRHRPGHRSATRKGSAASPRRSPGPRDRPTNPLGIQGHGSDIAYLALFLCSPAARFVSGQVIAVDGAGSTDMLRIQAGKI